VDPDQEADILRALEDLDRLALGGPGAAGGGGSGSGRGGGPPQSAAEAAAAEAVRKSKVKSMIKGVGSYLGLRKSKKRRQAEMQAGGGGGGGGGSEGVGAGAGAGAGDASLLRRMFRSSSSPSLQSEDSRLRVPGSPILVLPGTPTVGGFSHASSHSYNEGPARDDNGLFMPNHRRDIVVRGIVKSPAGSARRSGGAAGEGGGGEGGGAPPPPPPPPPGTPLSPASAKRRIAFLDHHGGSLEVVHFSDTLHYSEGAEHVDWEDEDDNGKCALM
jgi:hypothetical protein